MDNALSIMLIAAADLTEAGRISDILINEQLAACVSKFPVDSVFRWQGKVEHSHEVLLVIKTRSSLEKAVIKRVKEIHSYEVPEIIVLPISNGNAEYLKWIESQTGN